MARAPPGRSRLGSRPDHGPPHGTLLSPSAAPSALLSQLTVVLFRISLGPAMLRAYPAPSVGVLPEKTVSRPQPSTATCTWKPSPGEVVPELPATVQPLPFTSTHESTASRAPPSKTLSRTTPSLVPSLMSTASAVVPAMSLASIRLRSLRSGSQSVIWHQLLWALPT